MEGFPAHLANNDYCYLLTTGRKSGLRRETEIWFVIHDGTLYVASGGRERSQWVKNLHANPQLVIRLGDAEYPAVMRDVTPEEDSLARRLLLEKYQRGYSGSLEEWGRTALPLAFERRES